ncbi:hypothetical protein EC968_006947 [Mortierella alpina]|nr:hypothetical protein EC968_006947 [Mortierella alpina]
MSALSTIVNASSSSPKGKQAIATALLSNDSNPPANASHPTPTADISKSGANASSAEDIKYRRKYKDLKKRIRDIEEDNDVLNIKLSRARKNIHRLRVERRLDQSEHGANPSSSTSSSSDSDTDGERNGGESSSRSHRRHSRHGLDRYKHHRHPYSHHNSQSQHGRHGSSNSVAPPSNAVTGRSKTPPSRGSSIARSAQHSASSSIGGPMSAHIMDPPQANAHPPTAGGKKTIKKRRKDPLAPKRPSNAFFIFSQQHRQQAREEKKEGNQSELTKFLGLQWKSMPSTEKKIYSELAIQDRQRYLEEMTQYQHEQLVHGTNGIDGVASVKRKPGKPGRPPKSAKISIDAAAATAGIISHTTTVSNGHSAVKSSSSSSKMEIRSMVNVDTEGDEMMSHDDDEDVRMEVGSEDEHEDEDDEEEEDEGGDDDDDAEEGGQHHDEVIVEDDGEEDESDEAEVHVTHGQHHNYTADVEMAHKAQEIGSANRLVVSA